jgi:hypothetical protein
MTRPDWKIRASRVIDVRYCPHAPHSLGDERGRPQVSGSESPLLALAALDHLLDLLLHRVEVEGSRVLHRRVVDGRQRQFLDILLNHDEAPEFAGVEVVPVAERTGIGRLAPDHRRALERILANVNDGRHVGRGLFARPAVRLRIERELEVFDANRAELRAAKSRTALGA